MFQAAWWRIGTLEGKIRRKQLLLCIVWINRLLTLAFSSEDSKFTQGTHRSIITIIVNYGEELSKTMKLHSYEESSSLKIALGRYINAEALLCHLATWVSPEYHLKCNNQTVLIQACTCYFKQSLSQKTWWLQRCNGRCYTFGSTCWIVKRINCLHSYLLYFSVSL